MTHTKAWSLCSIKSLSQYVIVHFKARLRFVFRAKSSRFIGHSNDLLGLSRLLLEHCKRRVLVKFYLQDDRVTSYVTQRCELLNWRTRSSIDQILFLSELFKRYLQSRTLRGKVLSYHTSLKFLQWN